MVPDIRVFSASSVHNILDFVGRAPTGNARVFVCVYVCIYVIYTYMYTYTIAI